jgi:hypothetical protein
MHSLPINAKELLSETNGASHYAFALIAHVVKTEKEIYIEVAADAPIAVGNVRLKKDIQRLRNVSLPLRKDINNHTIMLSHHHYVIGVCALLELKKDGDTLFPLLQRGADAPSNANAWTSPSGLCNESPADTVQKELIEELGLMELSSQSNGLTLLVPIVTDKSEDECFVRHAIAHKQTQEATIRAQLPAELAELPLHYKVMPLKVAGMFIESPPVYLKLPHDTDFQPTPFHATFDDTHQALTLTTRFTAQLNHDAKYILVDPEPFARHTALVNKEQLQALPCTPALADMQQLLSHAKDDAPLSPHIALVNQCLANNTRYV